MTLTAPDVDERDRDGRVQSVDRALAVLDALGSADHPVGVSEISRTTGLPQTTVHRLLRALVARGYARHDTERKYGLGAAALHLGETANRSIASISAPYLRELVDLSGETANLALHHGVQMVYAAQAPSHHTLRTFAEVGRRVPLHSTAVGKAALAAMEPDAAHRLTNRLQLDACTTHTITSRTELIAELERVREHGFAVDDEEHELGVRCVAVPVPDILGPLAAISVSGPAERLTLGDVDVVAAGMSPIAARLAGTVLGTAE